MPEPWLKQQFRAEEGFTTEICFKTKTRITTPKFSVHGVYVPWHFSQAMPKTKSQGRLMSS